MGPIVKLLVVGATLFFASFGLAEPQDRPPISQIQHNRPDRPDTLDPLKGLDKAIEKVADGIKEAATVVKQTVGPDGSLTKAFYWDAFGHGLVVGMVGSLLIYLAATTKKPQ